MFLNQTGEIKMNIKYNNSLYSLNIPEIENSFDELEELIMNYDPVSLIKDAYNEYIINGGE